MKKRRMLAGAAVVLALVLGLWGWVALRSPYKEPSPLYVLMFHHFVPDGTPCNDWTLTESGFREELQWLSDRGYTTVLPSELVRGDPLPERAVMLTFDDGYASNYHIAYPILQEFQAKAVIAPITQRIESGHPDFLTWEMCREMADSGLVEFGSHTHDLHSGDEVNGILRISGEGRSAYQKRVGADLRTSVGLLEAHTGKPVQFFAYPHGLDEPWARSLLRRTFGVSVLTLHGTAELSDGLYRLPRMNITMENRIETYLQ